MINTRKIIQPIDMKGAAGRMLRGNKVYKGGARVPNPSGKNTQFNPQKAAAKRLRMKNGKLRY